MSSDRCVEIDQVKKVKKCLNVSLIKLIDDGYLLGEKLQFFCICS